MSEYRQQRFADTLIELMNKMPLSKITVKKICDQCGEHRQTFYYYFIDKYDLITWIYYQDAVNTIEENQGLPWVEVLERIFEKMYSRRAFYANAFSESGQNALIHSILEHDIKLYTEMLQKDLGVAELDSTLSFSIKYHAYACVNITKDWLESGSGLTPTMIAGKMYENMPGPLRRALPE